MALLRMHMNAAPTPPRKMAPEQANQPAARAGDLRALEKERDARFYHCDEFLAALDDTPRGAGDADADGGADRGQGAGAGA